MGFLAFCPSWTVFGESPGIKISSRETWTTVFGDSTITRRFDVAAKDKFNGTFRWSYSANGRTIDAGEQELRIAGGGSVTADISLRIPAVNEGASFPTQLTISVLEEGQRTQLFRQRSR